MQVTLLEQKHLCFFGTLPASSSEHEACKPLVTAKREPKQEWGSSIKLIQTQNTDNILSTMNVLKASSCKQYSWEHLQIYNYMPGCL